MRSIDVSELKMKIFLEQKSGLQNFDCDSILKIDRASENCLIFSELVDMDVFNSIKNVNVYFHVSGKWKLYNINNIRPLSSVSAVGDGKAISGINFSMPNDEIEEYYRDFTLARC